MKPLIAFFVLGGVMVLLAAVAIGAMISIGSGRPSWLLIGVFVLDSLALLLLAGHSVLRRRKSNER
ncbi:MAG: hypothetical protein NCW75_13745 [Phycisphaera sp.]|nr:MAG: hypothetical protein NCW75_13745 [Phycisphaera sp.]